MKTQLGIGLSPDEERKVRAAAASPADADALVDWAQQIRSEMPVLELVLRGHVTARVRPEDGELVFSINEASEKYVEERLLKGGLVISTDDNGGAS